MKILVKSWASSSLCPYTKLEIVLQDKANSSDSDFAELMATRNLTLWVRGERNV